MDNAKRTRNPIKQLPTFVARTYRGGAKLREFLRLTPFEDSFYPEDWISSFIEAKNAIQVPNEGLTRVFCNGNEKLITEVVDESDFGKDRKNSGVLIKFLDAAERLGIQVHPTKEYAKKFFNSEYGKTECWHIIDTRIVNGAAPCVYLGFKEHITKEIWSEMYKKQDIDGMIEAMHCFEVKKGDTILVEGGIPHAIGAGCFMLEIQEPSDYTMRVERVTVAGETLTDMQIHYGVGEENMLECFNYTPLTKEEIRKKYFLSDKERDNILVSYDDTSCFALKKATDEINIESECCVTAIFLQDGGRIYNPNFSEEAQRGDKFFIPAGVPTTLSGAEVILCYPPQKSKIRKLKGEEL